MRTLLLGLLLAVATGLQAAEIRVFASNAVKTVLEELSPEFEKATGHKVTARFAPAAELKGQIEKGEPCEVAILTAALIDDLFKQSRIAIIPVAYVGASATGANIRRIFERFLRGNWSAVFSDRNLFRPFRILGHRSAVLRIVRRS
jgi:hypothetical protein